jgi:hypothetical protein
VRVHHLCQVSDVVDANGPRPNDDIPPAEAPRSWLLRTTAVTNTPRSTRAYNIPLFLVWIDHAYADPRPHDFSPLRELFGNHITGSIAMVTHDRVEIDARNGAGMCPMN